jgi:hypothetical protein
MASQINEIISAAIAYNLTILVRQMFEGGLLPDFLHADPNALGNILSYPELGSMGTALGPLGAQSLNVANPIGSVAEPSLLEDL